VDGSCVEKMEEVLQIPCVKHVHVVLHQHPHIVQAAPCNKQMKSLDAVRPLFNAGAQK
jgi:hypothetical protein